jgi:adenosylcobinamide-GDP ribazoletransferase
VRRLAAALAFLTRVPAERRVPLDAHDVARGSPFFPLVGGGIGATTALVAVGCDQVLPAFLAAVLAVAFEAAVTGAIHLDALADLADSLGARSREIALEIMRDPALGAFGSLALVVGVLLKTGALASLLAEDGFVPVMVAAFALGRATPLVLGWILPYARPDEGSGRALTDGPRGFERIAGLALAAALVFPLTGLRGLALVVGAAVGTILVATVAWRRLGGATGDVLGAGVEVATLGALLAGVATA